jgi:hypothetical protein
MHYGDVAAVVVDFAIVGHRTRQRQMLTMPRTGQRLKKMSSCYVCQFDNGWGGRAGGEFGESQVELQLQLQLQLQAAVQQLTRVETATATSPHGSSTAADGSHVTRSLRISALFLNLYGSGDKVQVRRPLSPVRALFSTRAGTW